MRKYLSRAIGIFVLFVATASLAADPNRNLVSAPSKGGRYALVIGNAAYSGVAALKNPANDANDLAARLRKLNFDVTIKVNVGLKEMLRALTAFGNKIQPDSEVLVFYAGHGMQVKGKNYLIPIDAEIRNETAVSSEAVDVDQLLDKLVDARLSMVILDACRNNPFERRFRGYGQGLAQINAPTGTLIAYSTAPGKVASDGDGRNGLYTQELLAALDVPGIRVEDVFKRVRVRVVKLSNDAQTPWESSSLTGDFYFSGPGNQTVVSSPLTPVATGTETQVDKAEQILWNAVEQSATRIDYEVYLQQHPQGHFVPLAMARLDQLKQDAAVQEEEIIWKAAEQGSKADVATYLERFPSGQYSGLARLRLTKMQKEEENAAGIYVGNWTCVMKAATGTGHTCHFQITRSKNNDFLITGAYEWNGSIGAGVKMPFLNARVLDGQLEFQIENNSGRPFSTVKLRAVSASRLEGTINESSLIYATKH